VRTSETTTKLLKAISDADLQNPAKSSRAQIPTKSGGSFSYTYAALEDILAAIAPSLRTAGLVLSQEASTVEGRTSITSRLSHVASGEWMEAGPLAIPHSGDPQAVGSAITYGRRYQLLGLLGLAAEDDDGQSARDWERATTSAPSGREDYEGRSTTTTADEAPATAATSVVSGKDAGDLPVAGAPTFRDLTRLAGSAAAAREQLNKSNDTDYNARTVNDATEAELKLAIAEWMETHPSQEAMA
jgi:hypothetical protein